MATKPGFGQKPLEWVTSLIARFEDQVTKSVEAYRSFFGHFSCFRF